MRISALTLSRYGHFEDERLVFAPGAPDLHLIVGDNEAGKTTIRHALMDLLFGIAPRGHAYAFDVPASQLRLDAELVLSGETFAVTRTSSSKAGLTPPDAAAALSAALGKVDRALFEATRAFSHDEMRAAAHELQHSRGALQDVLMASTGGLGQLDAEVRRLADDAGGLFDRRKTRRSAQLRQELTAFEEASERYRTARLSAEAHRGLRAAIEDAEVAHQAARAAAETARGALRAAENVLTAEPIAARMTAARDEREDLLGARLPEGALEAVQAVAARLGEAQRRKADAETQCTDLLQRRDDLVPDQAVLSRRAEIAELFAWKERQLVRGERRVEVAAQRQAHLADAARLARSLGLRGEGVESLADCVLPELLRTQLTAHMRRRGALEASRSAAAKVLAGMAKAPPPVPPGPSPGLQAALAKVEEFGRIDGVYRDALGAVEAASAQLAEAERAAACDPVCDLTPPHADEGDAAERAIERATEAVATAEVAWRRAREGTALKAETARRSALAAPSREALVSARAARDGQWERIVAGAPVAEEAPTFRAAIDAADQVADARFESAHAVAAADAAEADLAEAKLNETARTEELTAARADLDARKAGWKARLAEAGLHEVPQHYRGWFERRLKRVGAAQTVRVCRTKADEIEADMRRVIAMCAEAMDEVLDPPSPGSPLGPPPEPLSVSQRDGPGLIAAYVRAARGARAAAERVSSVRQEAMAAHKAFAEAQAQRPQHEADLATANAALEAWHERWTEMAERFGLDPTLDHDGLEAIVVAHARLEDALQAASVAADELASIDAQEAEFTQAADALGAALGDSGEGGPRVAAVRLNERLAEAVRLRREREAADAAVRKAQAALHNAEATHAEAFDAVGELRRAADLPDDASLEALTDAARASDRRRVLDSVICEGETDLAALGLSWPQVSRTLEETSAHERQVRKAALSDEVNALDTAVSVAAEAQGRARAALDAAEERSKTGDARRAQNETMQLSAAMAQTASDAVDARLALTVLEAARSRFAARHESPLLARAEALFATLSGGRYPRLSLDYGEGAAPVVLVERPQDGIAKRVPALSDGTRDQLVLAVRLAAAEADALPFIADDLFVNADDTRAGYGFEVLAQLAAGRQVFYLTHHAHLADVARRALGGDVGVTHLPAPG